MSAKNKKALKNAIAFKKALLYKTVIFSFSVWLDAKEYPISTPLTLISPLSRVSLCVDQKSR